MLEGKYSSFTYVTVPVKTFHVTWFHSNEYKTPIVLSIFNCFTPKCS